MNKIHLGIVAVALMLGLSVVGQAQTLSVTNGLTLQLKADGSLFSDTGGTAPVSDGSNVALWQNAGSAIGSDATQSSIALQPTFHTGVLNGLPVVRFDGVNDALIAGSAFTYLSSSAWTTFAIFKANSISSTFEAGYDDPAIWMNSSGDEGMSLKLSSGTPKVMAYNYPGNPSQAFNLGEFTFAVATRTAANALTIQSAGAGSGTTGTVTSAAAGGMVNNGLYIGKNYQSVYFLDADVAEILMYNRTLDGAEMNSVMSYLNDKYALGLGITAVPEPSSVALVCGAGLALFGMRRRRA